MTRQGMACLCVGLLLLGTSCGDGPVKGGMWIPLGSAEAATATAGASETICSKLETCGVLQKLDVPPEYDYDRQGLHGISSAIYSQVSSGSLSSDSSS